MWSLKISLPILVYSFSVIFKPSVSEIFTAQVELESLFELRKSVTDAVQEYLEREELRLQLVREKFLISSGLSRVDSPMKQSIETIESETKDSDNLAVLNPINAFLAIKGLSMDLTDILVPALDKSNIKELSTLMESLSANRNFPDNEDIKGAAIALIRLQDTYQLKTDVLSQGCLNDNFCSIVLSVDDCFEIGKQSYLERNYEYAILWFKTALSKFEDNDMINSDIPGNDTSTYLEIKNSHRSLLPSPVKKLRYKTSKTQILNYLSWAEDIRNTLKIGKQFLSELTGIELDAFIDEVVKAAESQPGDDDDVGDIHESYSSALKKYEALCRGEMKDLPSKNPKLKCSYSTRSNNPYFLLGPVQEEQVNLDPPVWIFHNVIYDSEIRVIKKLATPNFETAKVVNSATGGQQKSHTRVSKSAWLIDDDDEVVAKVNRRISLITNLDMDTAEDLQVANYGIGGMYLPHFDFSHTIETVRFLPVEEGNRIATLMFYMSDVHLGGATVFPNLTLSIWPEKGAAAFWYNLKVDGRGDFRTQHGACPVLLGSKWVSNKWMHERGQEFRRRCEPKPQNL